MVTSVPETIILKNSSAGMDWRSLSTLHG